MNPEDRYQFQTWYVRVWRRLRYQPLGLLFFAWCVLRWALVGFQREDAVTFDDGVTARRTRLETLKSLWMVCESRWHFAAGRWITEEEAISDLRKRNVLGDYRRSWRTQ